MTELAARFAAVTVVAEGDGYVLGSPYAPDYVAVPAIGGAVVRWLQAGLDLSECAERAARVAGEPVDVAGFVAGLSAAGVLPPAAEQPTQPTQPMPPTAAGPGRARLGRVLFGPAGLAVQGALALAGPAVLAVTPPLRPSYQDLVIGRVPLLSVLAVAAITVASGLQHELAHLLAAAAQGVPSRITVSRRLVSVVLQTDLTGLWGVPRRRRVTPLVAGMLSDAATAGVVLLAGLALRGHPWAAQLVRTVALLKLTGIALQAQIFMRTDVYALYALATRSRNLWDLKGALARRAIGRATAADAATLAAATAPERRWAGVYLALYLPGVAGTAWYTAFFAVPALDRLVRLSVHGIAAAGPASLTGAAGIAALAITTGSTAFVLRGLGRSAWRLARQLARPATAV